MNAIEIMLKVLKDTNNLGFIHSFEELEDAIKVGEAELKREPVAWMDKHGNIERGWDAILNPNEFKPLYTRDAA